MGLRDGRAGISGHGKVEGEDQEAAAHLEAAVRRGSRGGRLAPGWKRGFSALPSWVTWVRDPVSSGAKWANNNVAFLCHRVL